MSEPLWFILRHPLPAFPNARNSAQLTVDSFNRWENARLELFAPTIVSESIVNGKRVERERPLLFNYVFLRGSFAQVKDLCTRDNGFSFVIDSRDALIEGTDRYATLSDSQMETFKRIAFANRNRLSVVSLEDVDLQQGDEVEVIEGPFAGLKGTFMPRTKSTSGNILLQATSASAVALFDIKAKYIRVLRFAPGSKRAYDQIDAFLPRLFDALRAYAALIPLTTRQITRLTAFVRRFGATRIDAPKTHAKLQLLLQAANAILGNSKLPPPVQYADNQSFAITNPSTRALQLLFAPTLCKSCNTSTGNDTSENEERRRLLEQALTLLPSDSAHDSQSDRQLRAELHFHLDFPFRKI